MIVVMILEKLLIFHHFNMIDVMIPGEVNI